MFKKVALVAVVFMLPVLALAQIGGAQPGVLPDTSNLGSASGVQSLGRTIVNWLFGILLVLAVIFIVWAAFLYLTSGGDEEKTKNARNMIVAAVIAIAIAILARGIVALVGNFFGVNTVAL